MGGRVGGNGYCVTVVENSTAREVLTAMVLDPATQIDSAPAVRRWAWDQRIPDYATAVEATTLGTWAVTFEGNGFLATLEEVICRLSAHGPAIALFRNVNAVSRFIYARDGSVVRSFDPLLFDNTAVGDALPEEDGLKFGTVHPMAPAFACAERITGVRVTKELLDARNGWIAVAHFPNYSITPGRSWREDKAAMERAAEERQEQGQRAFESRAYWRGRQPSQRLRSLAGNVRGLARLDRDLPHELDGADEGTQRAVALWAAHHACTAAQLDAVDWVAIALRALDEGDPLPPPFDQDVGAVWALYQSDPTVPHTLVDAPEGGERNRAQQAFALPVIWGAGDSDPLRAACDALFAAAVTWVATTRRCLPRFGARSSRSSVEPRRDE